MMSFGGEKEVFLAPFPLRKVVLLFRQMELGRLAIRAIDRLDVVLDASEHLPCEIVVLYFLDEQLLSRRSRLLPSMLRFLLNKVWWSP
jgi:hypothetical protein